MTDGQSEACEANGPFPRINERFPVRAPISICEWQGCLVAICDDGTLWYRENAKWHLLEGVPQE